MSFSRAKTTINLLFILFSIVVFCSKQTLSATLQSIEYQSNESSITFIINLDQNVSTNSFEIATPARIVIDLKDTNIILPKENYKLPVSSISDDIWSSIRIGQYATDTARVVIELKQHLPFSVLPLTSRPGIKVYISRIAEELSVERPEIVAPEGMQYKMENRRIGQDNLVFHVMDVPFSSNQYRVAIKSALDKLQSREVLSDFMKRNNASAAVNGGYFSMKTGENIDLLMINGHLLTYSNRNRSMIGFRNNGMPIIFYPMVNMEIILDNGHKIVPVQLLNQSPSSGEIAVFTTDFGAFFKSFSERYDVTVQNGRISAIKRGNNTPIPANGFLFSLNEKDFLKYSLYLVVGVKAELSIHLTPPLDTVAFGVSAGPMLVHDGIPIREANEEFSVSSGITTGRHPRTAVCMTHNDLLRFVVVEGRNGLSAGATISELADIMAGLGCIDAINLDGGGSSEMIINGTIANILPGPERPLSNAILIIAN